MDETQSEFQKFIKIVVAEATCRNARADREAIDDILIDAAAGELISIPQNKNQEASALWQKFSVQTERVYATAIPLLKNAC